MRPVCPFWMYATAFCCFACARPYTAPVAALGAHNIQDTGVFWSPQRRVMVDFLRDMAAAPDSVSGRDGYVKYALAFSDRRGTVLARATYSEVYVWTPGGGGPLPPATIFTRIGWSPDEKIALLPPESWEGARRTPVRKIVNLNSEYSWKEISIRFEHALWIDSAELAGEQPQPCGNGLAVFDGRNGRTRILLRGGQGFDYGIDHYAAPYLQTRLQPADCPDPTAAKPAECVEINVHSGKANESPCR